MSELGIFYPTIPEGLPDVTGDDDGMVLAVVDGEWDKANIPNGNLPPVTSADDGKALEIKDGTWGVGHNIAEMAETLDDVVDNFTITPSLNLFDPSTVEEGVYCASTNLNRNAASQYNVVTIPVEAGESYVFVKSIDTAPQSSSSAWRYIVFADSGMLGMSVLNQDTDAQFGGFTAPIGAAFAVITYYAANTAPMIFKHSIPQNWKSVFGYTSPDNTYSLNDDVALSPSTLGTDGKNIVDESEMINGYVNGGRYESASGTYKCSSFIPVQPNTTYYSRTPLRFVCHYNELKEYVSQDSADSITSFTTSATDKYIRITSYLANAGNVMVSTDENAQYEPYKRVFVNGTPLLNDSQKADMTESLYLGNTLKGKKWVVCGDSFTADGGTGTKLTDGLYKGQNYVYPYIIGNRTGANIVSFAAGGRTLGYLDDESNPNNANSLTCPTAECYYQNIPADADYITIYLGINDANYNIPVGTINDADTSTYMGAYNEVLTWLLENRPFAHIGIIVSNGTGSHDRETAQIAIAEKFGVPYINMNGDERTPAMIRTTNPDIPSAVKTIILNKQAVDPPSNTHPNDATHLFESTFIENFLKTL